MRDHIGFKDVFIVLKKRFVLIALITIAAALSSAAVNFYWLTPVLSGIRPNPHQRPSNVELHRHSDQP